MYRQPPPTIVVENVKRMGPFQCCCGFGCLAFLIMGIAGTVLSAIGLI